MVKLITFPSLSNASDDGLLAMGGDLSLDTLISAYAQGIFPWFNDEQPILWWSPDPRLVLFPHQIKISKSLAKLLRQDRFQISCDQAFEQVVKGCALRGSDNSAQASAETWITEEMHQAYSSLFTQGYAHSIEVWQNQQLVGGLYGVVLGKVFFGESMFSIANNASKVALAALCAWLIELDFELIDCQVASDHLYSMGAVEIPRQQFLGHLEGIDIQQNSKYFAHNFTANY